jgi:circadian clock protein KaiB
MNDSEYKDSTEEFEEALQKKDGEYYTLRLFVSGMTPRSMRAIENIKQICEEHLKGRYELEVIDIYQRPELARNAQLLTAPTLVKQLPHPLRKLIGDLSDTEKVLVALDLVPKGKTGAGVPVVDKDGDA